VTPVPGSHELAHAGESAEQQKSDSQVQNSNKNRLQNSNHNVTAYNANPASRAVSVPGPELGQNPCLEAYKLARSVSERGLMTPLSPGSLTGEQDEGKRSPGEQIDSSDCWPARAKLAPIPIPGPNSEDKLDSRTTAAAKGEPLSTLTLNKQAAKRVLTHNLAPMVPAKRHAKVPRVRFTPGLASVLSEGGGWVPKPKYH